MSDQSVGPGAEGTEGSYWFSVRRTLLFNVLGEL